MISDLWTRENIVWLAGLLEGEGAFYIRRRSDRRDGVAISLQMTDLDVVEKSRLIVGAPSVTMGDRAKHYPDKDWKNIYSWRLQQNEHAMAVMWAIYPFMGERRKQQIETCFQAWRNNGGRLGKRVHFDSA